MDIHAFIDRPTENRRSCQGSLLRDARPPRPTAPHRAPPPSQSCCLPLHDKVLLIHVPCGCDSAVKKNDVLIWAAAWTNLENIMLSERSRSQRVTFPLKYVFHLYERSRAGEDEEEISDCLGVEDGGGVRRFSGSRGLVKGTGFSS